MKNRKGLWKNADRLEGKGVGIGKAHSFEDESSSMIHEQLARLKFAEAKIPMHGKDVLDFGCGTGYNSYYISKNQNPRKVIGIDILQECIDYCCENYAADNTQYFVRDCLVYDPSLGKFDILICSEVLEHVHEQQKFLETAIKYLNHDGLAFISTPNKSLFSLSKNKSFLNNTHVSELFFNEFKELIEKNFSDSKIYSQVHSEQWHDTYINYASAANLIQSIEYDVLSNAFLGKIVSKILRKCLYALLFKNRSSGYKDVRDRRYTDFAFVEGCDNRAMWFVAIGKPKN